MEKIDKEFKFFDSQYFEIRDEAIVTFFIGGHGIEINKQGYIDLGQNYFVSYDDLYKQIINAAEDQTDELNL